MTRTTKSVYGGRGFSRNKRKAPEAGFDTPAAANASVGRAPRERRDAMNLYYADVRRHKLLTAEEERALGARAQRGDRKAIEGLVAGNLRLVVAVARRNVGRGVDLWDLIAEGHLGLLRAAEKYEPQRGFRFSTYATWWVRQFVERSIMNQGSTVRVPVHVHGEMAKVRRLRKGKRSGGDDMDLEALKAAGVDTERYGKLVSMVPECGFQSVSIDMRDDEGLSPTLVSDDDPEAVAQQASMRAMVGRLVDAVKRPRDREVLIRRFGLDGREPETLDELGHRFGVSRERIRQMEQSAIESIRARANLAGLTLQAVA